MNDARYKLTNSIADNENANNSLKEILKFKNISIIYKDRCVLEGINMIIKFMLYGKSRPGKSTLAIAERVVQIK